MAELTNAIDDDTHRVTRILTTLAVVSGVVMVSLTGIVPVLYSIFYYYFTWKLDTAVFNGHLHDARVALRHSYVARGIICLVSSVAYLLHLLYTFFHTPVDKRNWTPTNTLELGVCSAILIYSIILLYFGIIH